MNHFFFELHYFYYLPPFIHFSLPVGTSNFVLKLFFTFSLLSFHYLPPFIHFSLHYRYSKNLTLQYIPPLAFYTNFLSSDSFLDLHFKEVHSSTNFLKSLDIILKMAAERVEDTKRQYFIELHEVFLMINMETSWMT